jgi:hypothetical protein
VNPTYVDKVNKKTLNSPEPRVNELLAASNKFRATTDEVNQLPHLLDHGTRFYDSCTLIIVCVPLAMSDVGHWACRMRVLPSRT